MESDRGREEEVRRPTEEVKGVLKPTIEVMTSGCMAKAELKRTGGLTDDAVAKEAEWVAVLRVI